MEPDRGARGAARFSSPAADTGFAGRADHARRARQPGAIFFFKRCSRSNSTVERRARRGAGGVSLAPRTRSSATAWRIWIRRASGSSRTDLGRGVAAEGRRRTGGRFRRAGGAGTTGSAIRGSATSLGLAAVSLRPVDAARRSRLGVGAVEDRVFKPGDVYWLRGAGSGMGTAAPGEQWDPLDLVNPLPQQFLGVNTTYAAWRAECGGRSTPRGSRTRPKDPLKEAEFLTALPSPPCSRRSSTRASADATRRRASQAGCGGRTADTGARAPERPRLVAPPSAPAPMVDSDTGRRRTPPPDPEVVAVPVPVPRESSSSLRRGATSEA